MHDGSSNSEKGSSPLARGLHPASYNRIMRDRIIPARAGFTLAAQIKDAEAKDHPRSRGVYHTCFRARACTAGSSPLARGLRSSSRSSSSSPGIIPARAGFT